MKKFISLLLGLVMLFSLSVTSFAAEPAENDNSTKIVLGTAEDDEGYPGYFDNEAPVVAPAAAGNTSLRFSFEANDIYDLLTTRFANGKTVTTWNESNDYMVKGYPVYSPGLDITAYCRAGLCYYDSSSGIYETEPAWSSDSFAEGRGGTLNIAATDLVSELTYYGFCKNLLNGVGGETHTMSGYFYVYNVSRY